LVYGNVLVEPDGAGNSQVVHYGGDSGDVSTYRKGTLHFYHNTVISTRNGNTTLFRLSTNDESADCRNNIVYVTAPGSRLALLAEAGTLSITHNWTKAGHVHSHAGEAFSGNVTDDGSGIAGSEPGFLNFARQNFRLRADSACLNVAAGPHGEVSAEHEAVLQYVKHRRKEPRRAVGLPDIGAYEFSPFEAWREQQFGEEAENEAISGEAADPDGDGLANLVEYAFELDPLFRSREGLPRGVITSLTGADHFAIEFRRRASPSELRYVTAVTDDFAHWEPGCEYSDSGALILTESVSDASDEEWTRMRFNEPASAVSGRLVGVSVQRE
jgi:hypothetical protein